VCRKRVTTDIHFVLVFGVGAYIYIHTGIRRLSQSTILVVGWGEGGGLEIGGEVGGRSLLNFAHEERLERTRCVVPSQALSISVPQFQAVLLLAILVSEIVGLSSIPVLISYGLSS